MSYLHAPSLAQALANGFMDAGVDIVDLNKWQGNKIAT